MAKLSYNAGPSSTPHTTTVRIVVRPHCSSFTSRSNTALQLLQTLSGFSEFTIYEATLFSLSRVPGKSTLSQYHCQSEYIANKSHVHCRDYLRSNAAQHVLQSLSEFSDFIIYWIAPILVPRRYCSSNITIYQWICLPNCTFIVDDILDLMPCPFFCWWWQHLIAIVGWLGGGVKWLNYGWDAKKYQPILTYNTTINYSQICAMK